MKYALRASHHIKTDRLTIYLPDRDRHGFPVERIDDWLHQGAILLTKLIGGATIPAPAQGYWLNQETSRMVHEMTYTIFSFMAPKNFPESVEAIRIFISRFGRETNQQSVALEYRGHMYFIDDFSGAPEADARSLTLPTNTPTV